MATKDKELHSTPDSPEETTHATPTGIARGARELADRGRALAMRGVSLPVVAIAAGIVVVAACGFAAGRGSAHAIEATPIGKVAVPASELDTVIGTYESPTASGSVTIRDIMEASSSPDTYVNNDGEYRIPPADGMVGAIRTRIISEAAAKEGISVTDEDIDAYSHKMLGDDVGIKEAAKKYSMTEDAVKRMMGDNILADKLRDKVAGAATKDDIQAPTAPSSESEGAKKKVEKKYADYIIKLVGDEWDLTTGSWKDERGAYAQALKNQDFTIDGASYEAAEAAYYVAYNEYSAERSAIEEKWNAYVNDLMKDVVIQLDTAALG